MFLLILNDLKNTLRPSFYSNKAPPYYGVFIPNHYDSWQAKNKVSTDLFR